MAEEQTWPNQVCTICDGKIVTPLLVNCMVKKFSKTNPDRFYWDEGYICPSCFVLHMPVAMKMPMETK